MGVAGIGGADVAGVALFWLATSATGVTAARSGALVSGTGGGSVGVCGGGAERGGGTGGRDMMLVVVVAQLHDGLDSRELERNEREGFIYSNLKFVFTLF